MMKEEFWFVAECKDSVDNKHYRVWVHRIGSSARLTVDGKGKGIPVDANTEDEVVNQIFIELQMEVEKILSRAEVARATNKHLEEAEEASSDSEADDSVQIIDEESEGPSDSAHQQQSSAP
jgi:hypothetical protein